MVPDDNTDFESESSAEKATLDESEVSQDGDVPRALQKVELDLDDAPFLDEEEDEEPEPEPEEDLSTPALEEKPEESGLKRLLKNRKVLIGLAILFVIIVAIPVKIWLWPDDEKIVEEIAPVEPVEEVPIEEEPEEPEEIVTQFEPFWIETVGDDGKVHFLHLRLAFPTQNPGLVREIKIKTFIIRDAVYYYLDNKSFTFLSDTNNIRTVKKDLISVVNKYLGQDQLDTVLIEEYLVQ